MFTSEFQYDEFNDYAKMNCSQRLLFILSQITLFMPLAEKMYISVIYLAFEKKNVIAVIRIRLQRNQWNLMKSYGSWVFSHIFRTKVLHNNVSKRRSLEKN